MYISRPRLIDSAVKNSLSRSTGYNFDVDLHVHGAGWKLIPEGLQNIIFRCALFESQTYSSDSFTILGL